jgi:hypothetical protein
LLFARPADAAPLAVGSICTAADLALQPAGIGLGRMFALHYHSSALHQTHEYNQHLCL